MSELRSVLLQYAGRLLSARPYFSHKLALKLEYKARSFQSDDTGFDTSLLVTEIIAELTKAGYLDDTHYALELAKRELRHNHGPNMIRAKLMTHQLSQAQITAVIAELDPQEIVSAATRLTARESDPFKKRQLLYRRGFDTNQISRLLQNQIDDYPQNVVE